jgi:hypothetical protein
MARWRKAIELASIHFANMACRLLPRVRVYLPVHDFWNWLLPHAIPRRIVRLIYATSRRERWTFALQ